MRRYVLHGVAATIAAATVPALADDHGRHRLPQLSPAQPAALLGTCGELPARLAGLPGVAITGATGLIGSALVDHLRGSGLTVVALVRRPGSAPSAGNGLRAKAQTSDMARGLSRKAAHQFVSSAVSLLVSGSSS